MFFEKNIISFKEDSDEQSKDLYDKNKIHTIFIFQNQNHIGFARYRYGENMDLILSWLEIKEKFCKKDIGRHFMDYICQKALGESKALIIQVMNEEELNEFYYNGWFSNRFSNNPETDDEIKDYFDCLIASENCIHFCKSHPTLILNAENIAWKPNEDKLGLKKSLK